MGRRECIVALPGASPSVSTRWLNDNNPGSTVQVTVSYGFTTLLVPLSENPMTLQTTARQVITH